MGIMTPHIRVLRAEADALNAEAEELKLTSEQITAAFVLRGMSIAKLAAAKEIEAECLALQNKIVEIPARGRS